MVDNFWQSLPLVGLTLLESNSGSQIFEAIMVISISRRIFSSIGYFQLKEELPLKVNTFRLLFSTPFNFGQVSQILMLRVQKLNTLDWNTKKSSLIVRERMYSLTHIWSISEEYQMQYSASEGILLHSIKRLESFLKTFAPCMLCNISSNAYFSLSLTTQLNLTRHPDSFQLLLGNQKQYFSLIDRKKCLMLFQISFSLAFRYYASPFPLFFYLLYSITKLQSFTLDTLKMLNLFSSIFMQSMIEQFFIRQRRDISQKRAVCYKQRKNRDSLYLKKEFPASILSWLLKASSICSCQSQLLLPSLQSLLTLRQSSKASTSWMYQTAVRNLSTAQPYCILISSTLYQITTENRFSEFRRLVSSALKSLKSMRSISGVT